jgi:head-tail adaptor
MAFDPCVIAPGTLKHSITIQGQSKVPDADGQLNAVWSTVLITRAAITSTSSISFKMSFQNSALASNATDLLTIRYPGASIIIVPGMQILYGTQTYTIQDVDNVQERNRVINMACIGMDNGSN